MGNKTYFLSFDIDEYNYRECQVHNHGFYLGQQSKQVEIDELIGIIKTSAESEMYLFDELQKVKGGRDELQKRLNMYEREGYKLVPVEPTKNMIISGNEYYSESCSLSGLYKAMIGEETK